MNLTNNPTKSELRELLASCNDDAGHHIIWVGPQGDVNIELLPGDMTPVGWAERMGDQVKFRFETLQSGNDYVGQEASEDKEWLDEVFDGLTRCLSTPGSASACSSNTAG